MTDTSAYSKPVKVEEKFISFINESLYGYVEFDLEGYARFANKSAEEITGYCLEDNMNFRDVIIDEDLERAMLDFELVMTESNAGPREYRLRRKDEVIIDIEVNSLPIKKQNEIIGFQSTVLDISDRKKIERDLVKSEMRYRSILETMEDEYFEFDLEGNATFFNRSSMKKSGLTEDELAGLNYKDTMDPKTAARVFKAFNTIYMTGQPDKVEMGLYYKDEAEGIRKKRYIENSAQLMKDEEGRKIGFQCVLRDITERKMYERNIRENELKFTKLFESLREGIIISDSDGKIEEINYATLDMLGYTDKKELIGKKTVELYADAMQREAVFKELNRNGFVNNFELTFKKSDNTLIDTVGSAAFRRDNEGNVIGVEGIFVDISTEKKVKKALEESEEEYRLLVQTTNDLVVRVDREGIIKFVNRAFKEVISYEEQEVLNQSLLELIHPEDMKLFEGQFALLLEGKNVENVEFRQKTKSGQYISVSLNAVPLHDLHDNIIGILGFGRNVTELKKIQDNLKESEGKYKSLVMGLMDGIVIARGEKILFANEVAGEMFGYANVKEMLGNPMTDFIASEDRDMMLKRGEARERGGIVPDRYTFKAIRKDGNEFEAELSADSIMYEGKIARQAVLRDITQQKITERKLMQSEKKYRTIFESMREGLVIIDSEGKIETVNPAALEIFGYSKAEEIMGKYESDGYDDIDLRKAVFRELNEKGFVKDIEIPIKKSDGTLVDILGSATLHKDDAGNLSRTEVIFTDTTDKKRMEDKLKKSELEYRSLVESLNDLIFSVGLDGKYLFLNKAFERLFDYPIDVMKKVNGFAYVHPDDLERVQEKFRAVIEGRSVKNIEFMYKKEPKGESYINLSVNAAPLFDEQKNIIGVTGVGRDITELKRTKQELQRSISIADAYMEATTDSAVLIELDGIIVDANKEFGKRFSKNIAELKGKNVFDLFPGEIADRRKKGGKKVVESRKPFRIQDNREGRWNDATIFPLFNDDGNVYNLAIFTHDITDLKITEKELIESKKELENKVLKRTAELEEVNIALRVLVKNRDIDVDEMENRIVFNLHELVFPGLEKLNSTKLNNNQITMIDIIKKNLVQITSQFSNGIESGDLKLTPAEMNIANLVKQGKTNREIAELYQLSARTVESHRDSIRKKIGIKNKKINLRSYLMSN